MAHLYQMEVMPEFRRSGTGRLLLDAAIDGPRRAGAFRLDLDVTCGDTPAVWLYARAGFKASGDPEPLRSGSALMKQPMRRLLLGKCVE